MKKILTLFLVVVLLVSGCSKESKEDLIEDFEENVTESSSYQLSGKMEIYNGEDKFTYNIEANYLKDDYYKVILINETNNHEQIILKNDTGVYVITPSLNKSFKFDSVWPENSSQVYLLASILNDITSDDKNELLESEKGYIIKSTVNYPNNKELLYQKVYFDDEMIPTSVEVYDENDNVAIKVNFNDVNLKAKLDEEDFALEKYIDQESCISTCNEDEACEDKCEEGNQSEDTQTSGSLDGIIYPLYVPLNTSLTSSEKINNEFTDRAILTFGGEKNFVLVEEASQVKSEFEIIPVNGDPVLLNDTVGAIGINSMYFTRNSIDYYLVSNDLTSDEMVNVALSMGNEQTVISTK